MDNGITKDEKKDEIHIEEQKLMVPEPKPVRPKSAGPMRSPKHSYIKGSMSVFTAKDSNETIKFAGFLYDNDPSMIFVVTYD